MYLRWIGFALLDVAVLIVAYLLAPLLPLFAIGKPTLPAFLSWFQTPDNPLDGDANFMANVAPFKGVGVTGWRQYVNRVFWLWRNPSYGFDLTVVSFQATKGALVTSTGTLHVSGGPTKTGWFHANLINPDGSWAWQFYFVWCYSNTRAFRLDLGWKLWNPTPCACQFAMTIQPFMSYS